MRWIELEQKLINSGLLPIQARELIWEAISGEVIKVVRTAPMVEDQVLSGDIPYENILSSVRDKIGTGIIVTVPAAVSEESTSPTLLAFSQIIAAAKNTVYVISPYIDAKGVETLNLPLQEAQKRGVQLMAITRETAKRQASRTRGLEALSSIFANQLHVRDYHTEAEGLSHYTSVHAKLIQADDQIGYVGSAELRGNALEKNFEMGCILTTEQAANSLAAFKAVWQIARPVVLRVRS